MWRRSIPVLGWVACGLAVVACRTKDAPAQRGPAPAAGAEASAARSSAVVSTRPPRPPRKATPPEAGPHELADCSDAELRACLAPFIKPELGADDIRALASTRCFKSGAEAIAQAGDCLPLDAGTDRRRRKKLVFAFYCSDVCPGRGGVYFTYADVSADECCKLGGEPVRDPFFGNYRGCDPAEETSSRGVIRETPDGKYRHVVSSTCPGRDPLIFEEWSCEPPLTARHGLGLSNGTLPARARYAPNAKRHPESDCQQSFDPALAESVLRTLDERAIECLKGHKSGAATLQVTFIPTGQASRVRLASLMSIDDAPWRCIQAVFERAFTQPFTGSPSEVLHELQLGRP